MFGWGRATAPTQPEQALLLPPDLRDWVPAEHLVWFVSDLVDALDLTPIEAYYETETRGQPPHHPRLMVKLLVYGYCQGVRASRKVVERLDEDVAFRALAAGNRPDFRTISDFRKIHLGTLEGLFEQVLRLALESGALKLGRVALDGTKMKANASKHKAMSWKRLQETEQRLRREAREILAAAEQADAADDARWGDKRGDELPAELARRERRLARIGEAKKALAERAAEAGEPEEQARQAEPRDKDRYNFTDPESRIMKAGGGFEQAYNAQAAMEKTKPQRGACGGAAGASAGGAGAGGADAAEAGTKAGKRVYARRKAIVEPVFGRGEAREPGRRLSCPRGTAYR